MCVRACVHMCACVYLCSDWMGKNINFPFSHQAHSLFPPLSLPSSFPPPLPPFFPLPPSPSLPYSLSLSTLSLVPNSLFSLTFSKKYLRRGPTQSLWCCLGVLGFFFPSLAFQQSPAFPRCLWRFIFFSLSSHQQ